MDFIGQVAGMNFSPISNYNNFLNKTKALEVDIDSMDFENVLNQQTSAMQSPVQGGVQMNNISDIAVQNTIQPMSNDATTGDVLGSFSKSINSGLQSVNNNIVAADKAQEAFAAGEDISVHDVMIASEKSTLSLQMAMQLRNKLMTAYTELNQVRV
jgi:flagellar hook-basal body complex protein FliE